MSSRVRHAGSLTVGSATLASSGGCYDWLLYDEGEATPTPHEDTVAIVVTVAFHVALLVFYVREWRRLRRGGL